MSLTAISRPRTAPQPRQTVPIPPDSISSISS